MCVSQSAQFSRSGFRFFQVHDFQTREVSFARLPTRTLNRRIRIKIRPGEIRGSSQLAGTDTAAPDRRGALAGKQPDRLRDLWSASTDGRTATMAAERSEEREKTASEHLVLLCQLGISAATPARPGGKSEGMAFGEGRLVFVSPQQRRFIIALLNTGGNLWLQFTAFIIAVRSAWENTPRPM